MLGPFHVALLEAAKLTSSCAAMLHACTVLWPGSNWLGFGSRSLSGRAQSAEVPTPSHWMAVSGAPSNPSWSGPCGR